MFSKWSCRLEVQVIRAQFRVQTFRFRVQVSVQDLNSVQVQIRVQIQVLTMAEDRKKSEIEKEGSYL